MHYSNENLTEIITSQDGIRFQLSSNYIYIHLPDNEQLIFRFRTSNGEPYFDIPYRKDIDMLVLLIKKGWFQTARDEVYIDTVLKTRDGVEIKCFLPY